MLKKMSEYTYHYGLMVRIYPSTEQKQVISVNSNVNRFVYNKMVQLGKEICVFGKPSIYIKVYLFERIKKVYHNAKGYVSLAV